jgi:hypothetical protein
MNVRRRSAKVSEGSPKKNVRKPSTTFGNVEKSGVMKERYCKSKFQYYVGNELL